LEPITQPRRGGHRFDMPSHTVSTMTVAGSLMTSAMPQ
jgi:hypothetical protein